ncbi:MAG: hypothetical protein LIO85_04575 [Rikenellaceae bacterium]|nr:hypothetical protein [Rikenellaceae bacterium]
MYFYNVPTGTPGAGGDIILSLAGCDAGLVTEARIVKDGEVLGIKRFAGEEAYDINAACYLRGTVEPVPLTAGYAGFHDHTPRMPRFNVLATQYPAADDGPSAGAVWIDSGPVRYTAGWDGDCPSDTDLTVIGDNYEITTGETVEFSFISGPRTFTGSVVLTTPDYSYLVSYINSGYDDRAMFTLNVIPERIETIVGEKIDETMEFAVKVQYSYAEVVMEKTVRVRDRQEGQVRLCWLNRYGALDYYTFSAVRTEELTVEKNRVLTGGGYRVARLETGRTMTVQTPYRTPDYIARIATVLSSPRVWRIENDRATEVDILSDRIELDHDGPQRLVLTFRDSSV